LDGEFKEELSLCNGSSKRGVLWRHSVIIEVVYTGQESGVRRELFGQFYELSSTIFKQVAV
jgi:hypothetical protein